MDQKALAIEVITRLRGEGYTALLAGGCVRDMLLGKKAKDFDVATNAHPDTVSKMFRRTLTVGAKFGVVVVLSGGEQVEVATFRTETGYVDGRHPGAVEFADAKEDASRRDFTINGMFYNPIEKQVIDYVGGQEDLNRGLIRTIGEARTRFGEDYLRMLRAVRFSTRLGFEIEEQTWKAVVEGARNITKISGERIAMELEAILVHPSRAEGARMLLESGLLHHIFPAFAEEQTRYGIGILSKLRKSVNFGLAAAGLFSKAKTSSAMKSLEILKLSNDRLKHIEFLLLKRGVLLEGGMDDASLKKLMASPYFRDLFELERSIQRYEGGDVRGLTKIKLRARSLMGTELTPKPLLNGHEIIAMGAIPGPQVGEAAEEMYIEQLNGHIKTPDEAKAWLVAWLGAHKRQ